MDDKIKTLRDALEWLYRRIREEAELDGEMSNEHAIQLGFITNMLEKFPIRQCDMGTAEEQEQRFLKFCGMHECYTSCPLYQAKGCRFAWAQMPYETKEGGAE